MKSRLAFLFAIVGMIVVAGCATLQLERQAATRPVTAQERVYALQSDLDSAWKDAEIAHNFGLINDQQFKLISTAYAIPQAAVNVAIVAAETKQGNLEDTLLEASKAIAAFKGRSKPAAAVIPQERASHAPLPVRTLTDGSSCRAASNSRA